MALSVVNFVTGGMVASGSSFSSSVWSSTSGNLLVVGIRLSEALSFVTSVKTQAGTSLTAIAGSAAVNSGSTQATQLFYLPNIVGNSIEQITVTTSNSYIYTAICVWEIQGALTSSVLDTAAEGVNASSSTTITTGAFTTTQPIEIICAMGGLPSVNNTYSGQAGYTMDSTGWPPGSSDTYCGAEHLITSSIQTGATVSLTGTVAAAGGTLSLASFIATTYSISGNAGVAGATVSYTGTASGSVTADGSGNYTISGLANGSYTITPSLGGYTFSPTSASETVSGSNITGVNFTASATTYSISGNAGVAGATVSYTGTASGSVTADGSGNYTISGLANGSYTITPSLGGYTFSPTSASETVSGSNITGVNFTASATTYSISGNAGVAGATVSYTGTASGSVTADGSGNYSITGLSNGSYTITPTKTGYTFSPTSASETVSSANVTGVNFTAVPLPASAGSSFGFGFKLCF